MKRADRQHKIKAASASDSVSVSVQAQRSRELELATLRNLPNNNNFVTENNLLYTLQPYPGEGLLIICLKL